MPGLVIPQKLLPADGRFGSGPSKVRTEAVHALDAAAPVYLGTSHRQGRVREVVARVRSGLAELFALPEGYEVVLGNGGTTAFWDAAAFCLVERQSQHLSFGEFSAKFAECARAAPFLAEPQVLASEPGTCPRPVGDPAVDAYCLTHNETSTGVQAPVRRPRGPDGSAAHGLVLVDATSAAGGLRVEPSEFDAYYFAPQKCFGSEGGLWLALLSPAAVERVERLCGSDRFVPAFLDLSIAITNSRLQQTYNTPALAGLFLLAKQVDWFLENGGLEWAAARCDQSAEIIYGWSARTDYRAPVRVGAGKAEPRHGHDRLRRVDRGTRGRRGATCQRRPRYRALPQARQEPAAHRAVPHHRPERRRSPDRVRRLGSGTAQRLDAPVPPGGTSPPWTAAGTGTTSAAPLSARRS